MSNTSALLVPPPGAGFVTVTFTAAADARAPVGTVATSEVAEPPVPGVNVVLPKFMVALGRKFVPVMVRITVPLPMMALVGEIDAMVGGGFETLNGRLLETLCPLATVMPSTPLSLCSAVAGIAALREPSLLRVVGISGVPETWMTDWLVKPTPVAVIEIGGAAFDSTGEISVSWSAARPPKETAHAPLP